MLIKLRNIRFIVFGFLLSGLLFFFRSTSNSFAFSFPFNCPFRFAFHFPFRFSFSLPSGVDFIEKACFKEDGSGTFSIAVDFRKASNLNWFVKLLNHGQIIESIAGNAFRQTQQQLQKIDGISKVDVKAPTKDMLIFELSFRFSHIQALNKAMGKINKDLDPAKITYFSLDDELFVREDINGITGKLLFYQQHDNCLVKSLRLASFFKETTYKTIYTFPRKRVKQFSNPLTSITKNGQGVCITIIHHVFAADQIDESIGNRVHFVKNSLKK